MILEEKILWVRSSIWNSSSLLRRWFQDCAVCTHPCLTLPTGLWRWPNQIIRDPSNTWDARVKANVHDRRPARVLPIEALLKSYRLAGGWTWRTVRPENSDTSHVLCVITRQSLVKIALLARSHIGDTAKVESPSKKPAPSTRYDGKVVLHKSIRISMEGSWPSDPKAKLPRPMLRRFLAGVCRGTYNDFHQFSSPLPVWLLAQEGENNIDYINQINQFNKSTTSTGASLQNQRTQNHCKCRQLSWQGGAMATKVLYRSRLVTQRSSHSGEFPKKPGEKMRHIFHLMHTKLRKSHNVT